MHDEVNCHNPLDILDEYTESGMVNETEFHDEVSMVFLVFSISNYTLSIINVKLSIVEI